MYAKCMSYAPTSAVGRGRTRAIWCRRDGTGRHGGRDRAGLGGRRVTAGQAGPGRASTDDQYRWAVECHIVPLIGSVLLRDLTPEVVDEWIRTLSFTEGGEKARPGVTSTRLVRKILSMATEDAVQRGRLPRNPVSLTGLPARCDRTR